MSIIFLISVLIFNSNYEPCRPSACGWWREDPIGRKKSATPWNFPHLEEEVKKWRNIVIIWLFAVVLSLKLIFI